MNWEETIISEYRMDCIIREKQQYKRGSKGYGQVLQVIKEAQAKHTGDIAYKEGIRTVVEFVYFTMNNCYLVQKDIEAHDYESAKYRLNATTKRGEAFLKEQGVE